MTPTNTAPSSRNPKQRGAKSSTTSAATRTDAPVKNARSITLCLPENQKPEFDRFGGSRSDHFNRTIIEQAINAGWYFGGHQTETAQQTRDAIGGMLGGIHPKDEIEGMLAAQMWATHAAAMEAHRRAMIPEQSFEGRAQSLKAADRCSRTFANLVDALNRHRGKGQQAIRVEHVTVNAGGQAIVGNVQGGGLQGQTEGQAYAKQDAVSSIATLPSPDPTRNALPIASGDRQEAVQDARRGQR